MEELDIGFLVNTVKSMYDLLNMIDLEDLYEMLDKDKHNKDPHLYGRLVIIKNSVDNTLDRMTKLHKDIMIDHKQLFMKER